MQQYEALARAATDSYLNNLSAEEKPTSVDQYLQKYMEIYKYALTYAVSMGDLSQEAYNQQLYNSQSNERYL